MYLKSLNTYGKKKELNEVIYTYIYICFHGVVVVIIK